MSIIQTQFTLSVVYSKKLNSKWLNTLQGHLIGASWCLIPLSLLLRCRCNTGDPNGRRRTTAERFDGRLLFGCSSGERAKGELIKERFVDEERGRPHSCWPQWPTALHGIYPPQPSGWRALCQLQVVSILSIGHELIWRKPILASLAESILSAMCLHLFL